MSPSSQEPVDILPGLKSEDSWEAPQAELRHPRPSARRACPAVAALEYNLPSKGESATVCTSNGIKLRMQKPGPAPHVRCASLLPR